MENYTKKPRLHYLVRSPKVKSEKPPLVILLHGVGSNEQDLFSFANSLPDNFLVVSARGPLVLGVNSYAWFEVQFTPNGPIINKEQAEDARKEVLRFIDDLKSEQTFDASRVYLVGFSQGGIISYSVALTEPEKVRGIAVMSSRLLPEIKPMIASNERLKKLSLFVSHGTQDPVLKFSYATDAVEYLQSKGLNPEFHSYNDVHTINNQMLSDMLNWLKKNEKE